MDQIRVASSKSVNVTSDEINYETKQINIENIQLKKANVRLKTQLNEIQKKLDRQIQKRLSSKNQKGSSVIEMELENAYKQIQIYKRQLKRLQKKTPPDAMQRIQQLNNNLKSKDKQIEQLRSQIKSLKKIKKFQEKSLVQVATEGVPQCWKQKEQLQQQFKKLEIKCENYERQLRKKSLSLKPVDQKRFSEENEKITNLEKQIQQLKQAQKKNKKQCNNLINQRNKYHEEVNQLKLKIMEKDRDIQNLNLKITELRKCLKIPRQKKQEQNNNQSSNQEQQPQKQKQITRTHISKPIRSNKSTTNNKLTKIQIVTYPRIQQFGQTSNKAIKFNDHVFGSKILGINACVDQDGVINSIQTKYEKGVPEKLLMNKQYNQSFNCQENQYVQLIQGGFNENFVEYLKITTNKKKVQVIGKEKIEIKKFSFNTGQNEFPVSIFGQLTQISNQIYRINRIGCFIQKV